MLGNLSGMHLLAVVAILLLFFGAPKLPGLARSLGQSMRILKKEVGGEETEAEASRGGKPTGGADDTADPR